MSEDKPEGTGAGAASALAKIINALEPLPADERDRTLNAAMVFYGIAKAPPPAQSRKTVADDVEDDHGGEEDDASYPPLVKAFLRKHGLSEEELDRAFHFHSDGTFDLHDAPGRSKKEKTLNTYVLAGLGNYLATGAREFEDAPARQFCEDIGCYDPANHAAHLKNRGPEYSGDKTRGYSLSNVGMKRGAALIKELAGGEAP